MCLTWRLEDAHGELIDELNAPTEFSAQGSELLPAVQTALMGQAVGFETTLHLEPEQAFGDYVPELVFFEERSIFDADIEVGLSFEGLPPGSQTQGLPLDGIYIVTEIYDSHVVLDGNHPLAGMALRWSLQVQGVRESTELERRTHEFAQDVNETQQVQ
jgi:FKBP-type peptidyl-prolyl cis-trans isomerase SlyD